VVLKSFLKLSMFVFFVVLNTAEPVSASVHNDQSMPYMDGDFACISQTQAQKYVKDFRIDTQSFGGFELCNSAVDFKKLMNDFVIIENGRFQKVLGQNNLFIRDFLQGQDYYTWAKSQTRGVERGQDIPTATAYNSGGYFTMQDGWARSSTLGRVGTFIHEARHTAGYRHYPCQQGSYQGSSMAGCDSSYSQGGSHAVEMEYYAKVSTQGVNFHPVYQKMARLMAIARANFLFNTPVLQKRETLFALSNDRRQGYLLENNKWIQREIPVQDNSQLKRSSFGAVMFDSVKAYAIEMYQNSGFSDLVLDTYSYFKILLDKNEKIKHFEEFDLGTQRFIVKIDESNQISSFEFSRGEWGRSYPLPFSVSQIVTQVPQLKDTGFYIIKPDGKVAIFQPREARVAELQNVTWDSSVVKFYNVDGQRIYLKTDGKLYVENSNQLLLWDKAMDFIFSDIVAVPLYNGFDVNVTDLQ